MAGDSRLTSRPPTPSLAFAVPHSSCTRRTAAPSVFLERAATLNLPRHRVHLGDSTAFALAYRSKSNGAKAVEPPGQAQWRGIDFLPPALSAAPPGRISRPSPHVSHRIGRLWCLTIGGFRRTVTVVRIGTIARETLIATTARIRISEGTKWRGARSAVEWSGGRRCPT